MTFVRQDVYSLAPDHPIVTWYGNAVAAMLGDSGPTGWIHQADMHATWTTPVPALGNECRHQSWYFLSWHRMYLYFFERIVRARVVSLGGPADWALPYWDYDRTGTRAIPPAFRSPTRPDGTPNPLFVSQRAPGINAGGTLDPAITTAAFALSRPVYTGVPEFGGGATSPAGQFMGQTGRLEQTPHNDIHVAVGGASGWMRDPRMAARDPIFWLHHSNVDRLWWEWNKTHDSPTDPAWLNQSFEFFDEKGQQTSMSTTGIQDIVKQLDYSYEKLIRIPPIKIRVPIEVFRRRPPWPPWLREVVVPRIPETTPQPPRPGPDPGPEMIGATDDALRLTGHTERIRVAVDQRARRSILGDAAPKRLVLDISDIDAEETPGTVYAVYVNLPEGASPEEAMSHHVGNVSLFGIERTRDPGNDEHAHGGMRVAVDITDLAAHLSERGLWDDDGLDVTFRPVGVQLPDEADDETARALSAESVSAEAIRADRVHEDLPIKIGRISLHVE